MKKTLYPLLMLWATSFQVLGQESMLAPGNNPADKSLIKEENYQMAWYMLKDSLKIEIGKVRTEVQKRNKGFYIITTVEMPSAPSTWVDSTLVGKDDLEPIYHSSFNPQRDMALHFSEQVKGYYMDKRSGKKTVISESVETPFFDSNFYPQLIRWLPLRSGYSNTISIFDYNPESGTGTMKATIHNTQATTWEHKGERMAIWKVTVTDDISENTAISTYFIDRKTRGVLRQEIDLGTRTMVMERKD